MWRVRRQFWRGCRVACMHWSNQCACCVRTYVEHRYSSPDHFFKRRPKQFSPTEISFIYLRQKQAWLDFSKRLCRPKRLVIVKLTRNVPTEMPSTVSMTKNETSSVASVETPCSHEQQEKCTWTIYRYSCMQLEIDRTPPYFYSISIFISNKPNSEDVHQFHICKYIRLSLQCAVTGPAGAC